MKIIDLKTFVVGTPPPHHGGRNWVFVKLTTDDGIEGIGEAYSVQFHPNTIAALIEDIGGTYVIDADPFKIERLWRIIYYGEGYERLQHHQHPDHTVMGVLSAIEMACWDIVGKALNQPVYNLLGGQYHDRLRSFTYLYPAAGDTTSRSPHTDPEQAAIRAAAYVEQGFTAVKFDPIINLRSSFDPREPSLEALDNAEEIVGRVREAVGSKCDILVGTHGQTTTSGAIRLARRLERFDPLWFEEPVPPENTDEMARVAGFTSIPVATGERLATKYEFRELLEKQAAAILQMALGRVGGILEAKKITGMAEAYYAQIAPHLYCGPIEAAANIQLDTCSPNFLIQESIETFGGFHAEILKEPIQWEDGYIIPPTKPGLGVELDEEVAAKHPFQQVRSRSR
ncbi:MAG: mandelate racemase/muconate lactonizing enzyme family protein [Pseudomonadales bacterium]|jgi:2-dehydro-3-deoxyphosphogalactonate aldolase|nr:mandelate racemase/muconate lactonizing enzyme family protein [Pseudomonadales bacterium]MDP7360029.1 mandelate racemase/muconate lactonizing enzyme family protein [Pseudomonadales bacterium]MDP7598102.1 mandelate racemase/muconate lactonizing enzyme family protein [Pseudomonadales bacterium]HJN49401.1 mandelate racemase/muconate lactonizing enzyme family protein [Pseudomonadales bacterium]